MDEIKFLSEKADKLSEQGKYNEIIELLTDEDLAKHNDQGLYVQRGAAEYNIQNYSHAVKYYNKAITSKQDYALAYYNRGLVEFALKDYDKAIDDYTEAIRLKPHYIDDCYLNRGYAWQAKENYKEAIDDYTKAIEYKSEWVENAYYSRALARKENKIDLEGSIHDFKKYLELTSGKNETWANYANYYIEILEIRINDEELSDIIDIVDQIKNILSVNDECITHYTSLSTLKSLILDSNKFRISEGNFMNDPFEGNEFFNFLQSDIFDMDKSSVGDISIKPFIGCFVTRDKHNDLNMWRFYGKENGIEAKGCAITLRMQNFIDYIKDSISTEKNKDARPDDESDIKFYRVAYILQNNPTKFYIPDLKNQEELENSMNELKGKVKKYKGNYQRFLKNYLNNIAFLFKNDAYKYENEVRLVVKGIGLPKKYNLNTGSPSVYIELTPIKDIVEQITLGPKVDTRNEWKLAFHYSYEERKVPEISISELPYR